MRARPVKVLYVLGFGRSGSTLLDLSIGEMHGFFSVGELQSLWRESLLDGRLCGCGEPVAECRLWSEILGGRDCEQLGMTPEEMVALQTERLNFPPQGRRLWTAGGTVDGWRVYAEVLGTLYRRIAEVTGANVVVDSSKLPSAERAFRRLDDLDVYYVHLVRDPRAVAFSWMRKKTASDRTTPTEMQRISAARAAATWTARQLAAERVCARARGRSLRLLYEDFVADPQRSLEPIAALVDEPVGIDFIEGRTAHLSPNHTVSGNPIRLRSGPLELKEDAEWKERMAPSSRRAVTAMCWPLLRRYGQL